MVINGREIETYFARPTQQMMIKQPFEVAGRANQYDVICTVSGGGLSGQAGAVRHGISRALVAYEPALRPTLKKGGFLTRESLVLLNVRSMAVRKRDVASSSRNVNPSRVQQDLDWASLVGRPIFFRNV